MAIGRSRSVSLWDSAHCPSGNRLTLELEIAAWEKQRNSRNYKYGKILTNRYTEEDGALIPDCLTPQTCLGRLLDISLENESALLLNRGVEKSSNELCIIPYV